MFKNGIKCFLVSRATLLIKTPVDWSFNQF